LRLRRKSSVNVEYIIISLIKELSNPELDSALTSTSEDPRLCWVELAVHCSEARGLVGRMRFQDLHWNNQGILKQVIEDHAVEDIDRAVITARCKERVFGTVLNLTNGLVMIL
jgi:hypothetical protein